MVMASGPNAQFSDLSIYDHDNWAHGEESGSTDGSFLIDETYEDPGPLSLSNSIGILNVDLLGHLTDKLHLIHNRQEMTL